MESKTSAKINTMVKVYLLNYKEFEFTLNEEIKIDCHSSISITSYHFLRVIQYKIVYILVSKLQSITTFI